MPYRQYILNIFSHSPSEIKFGHFSLANNMRKSESEKRKTRERQWKLSNFAIINLLLISPIQCGDKNYFIFSLISIEFSEVAEFLKKERERFLLLLISENKKCRFFVTMTNFCFIKIDKIKEDFKIQLKLFNIYERKKNEKY